MIEDMQIRNLSPVTQRCYVHAIVKFSRHFKRSPDRLGLAEVRAYQVHLVSTGVSWQGFNQAVCALRFLYGARTGGDGRAHPVCAQAATAAGGVERRLSRSVSCGGTRTQASDGVDDGLCRRASRLGGCAAQDLNKQIAAELGISEMTAKIHRGQGFARCRR
jgi:hypothetical protein